MRNADFLGKRLLFITAHPDDESYAVGGTIYANRKAGGQSFLMSATLGEKGKAHLLKPLNDKQLKAKRKKELECAAKHLKVSKLFILGLPDGGLNRQKPKTYKKIIAIAKEIKPDAIISFGKDGISGHLDHVAIGKASQKVAEKLKIPFVAFAASPARMKLSPKFFASRRRFGKYTKAIKYNPPTMRVKINPRIKIKAVNCHKTQLGKRIPFSHLPVSLRRQALNYEYFRT